jgi:hypothetical protein
MFTIWLINVQLSFQSSSLLFYLSRGLICYTYIISPIRQITNVMKSISTIEAGVGA